MPFALSVLLLVSLCLPNIHGNDVNNVTETDHTLVASNRPLHRNQTKTTRNDQLLSVLAARRREIIQKRFRTHIKNIVDISSGNSSSLKPTVLPSTAKTLNVHLNLSDILLKNNTNSTEENNAQPSTESNIVNVSSPRNQRKNVEASQIQENKTKNMPIIRNILYRRKMSFLNRKLPLDLEQIAYDTLGLSDINKNPEDLILDNEDSLQVEESSHDKLIYYDVKNNASKKSGNDFDDSDEIKTMSMNNKTNMNRKTTTTTLKPTTTTTTLKPIVIETTKNKTEIKQQNKNSTRFMSQSLSNYFRPLDVPEEEMQPFLHFGEKLPNKPHRNQSLYKTIETDKFDTVSTAKNEEEVNENMDVSEIKPQLIENKIVKVNVPKVSVARDYFKNRNQIKKNATEILQPPKIEKKLFNFRNITRNRSFRNATIFVQNKRNGIRHTINLKGNSSIANLKPATTTELIQNTTIIVTTIKPILNTTTEKINLDDKIIKLQNLQQVTPIKIVENQTEIITILPDSTTQQTTTKQTTQQTTTKQTTTKQTTTGPTSTQTTKQTTVNFVATTEALPEVTQTLSTKPTTRTTPRTTEKRTSTYTSTTIKTTESTTPTTLKVTESTKPITITRQSTTEPTIQINNQTTIKTVESTTTASTTGSVSTAVVTSVSIESSKSRANKTENLGRNTTDINLDFDSTVIANLTSQSFQNNIASNTTRSNPAIYPRISLENLTNTHISLSGTEGKTLFILRPTTTEIPTTKEFIIHVPDIETSTPETQETTSIIPETTTEIPEPVTVKITSRFNIETNITKQITTAPKRVFNTTVLSKANEELELPLATLFDFKKPELNTTKIMKTSETVISRKSESDISIENIHAAYILAALGFLPMMVIVIYVVRSVMKKKSKIVEDYEAEMHDSEKKSIIHTRLPTVVLDTSNKWEFPRSKLRLQTVLGQGNFGQVWKAEADDLKGHVGLTRLVAVKTIKDGAGTKERDDLLKELAIMQKMGSHPNVVTLLGCCTDKEPYLLIMEYVMYGKLLTFLRDHRTRRDYYNFSDDAATLTARDLTVFAYCVARGMEYLSSKGIIHRDLAARNILVDHNKLCKIADFGMSRDASGTGGEVTEPRAPRNALPVRWMAVESLLYSVFTHKTDVWAFGVLLWEIVTLGSSPYANMSGREVMRLVCAGYRLERPGHCRPELYGVMARTWTADPASRPTFAELRGDLAALLEQPHPDGSYVDLESFRADPTVYEIDNCTPRGNYFTVKSRFSEFECDI